MNPLSKELIDLNRDTFVAENKDKEDWETFLQQFLAADFRIRRANGYIVQNKWEMIEQIRDDKRKRHLPTEVGGGEEGSYGVVTSIITLKDDPDNKRYHNLKVFNRKLSSGKWQCVHWRVTETPREEKPGSVREATQA